MDWARENARISEKDLETVFRYEEKPATVVRLLASDQGPRIFSLESDEDWTEWLHKELPSIDKHNHGLVLILARRTGQTPRATELQEPLCIEARKGDEPVRLSKGDRRAISFPVDPEKNMKTVSAVSGRRSVRTLPFSQTTFRKISSGFYLHGSISRVVSRADVPMFSRSEVQMGDGNILHTAYVYNCRSTNAWAMDLALTATHFPHCGLTFAVLFGCPSSSETDILRRLSFATAEASHPLLMPGIFAELERTRHMDVVEATIDDLEEKILELDFQPSVKEQIKGSEDENRHKDKRSAWLDTAYLRNGLVSWRTQLVKIADHADELRHDHVSSETQPASNRHHHAAGRTEVADAAVSTIIHDGVSRYDYAVQTSAHAARPVEETPLVSKHSIPGRKPGGQLEAGVDHKEATYLKVMDSASLKIKDRILAIIDEYEDKIRECTMRVDGMAMATQWAQGETNVEIALATSRDSRHMRSIALVTMVFLPGTFFASVFSMTFFNWLPPDDNGTVSSFIWIYVVFTISSTLLTLGLWWYFVIYRQRRGRRKVDEQEEEIILN